MEKKLLNAAIAVALFFAPDISFGQAPDLGSAANFVLFSSTGAVTNSGIPYLTHLTGHVGTNSGSSTGFGNVDGVMHDNDGVSAACSADLLTAYGDLNTAIPTFFPAPLLGGGATLIPGVYRISSAATLNGNIILDGMGDPNAVFIFQIQGAFATTAASKVQLINGAVACNVFWKVEGLVTMATGTTMRGTIVAHNAAINMGVNDTLEGRALSINGAVTTNALLAYTPIGCGSPVLTGPAAPALVSAAAYGIFSSIGPVTNTGTTYVIGDVGTNSALTTGFNPLFVTGMIHPTADGSTAACSADLNNAYTFLNALPADIILLYPAMFGNDLVLTPHTYLLGGATTFTGNVYLNAQGDPNARFVIQISGALITSTLSKVILVNGAQAKNVYWKINGATHIYDNSVFNGTIVGAGAITLNTGDTLHGRAQTINGAVNINGSYVAITSNTTCVAPAIGGTKAVCAGTATTLTNTDAGGVWSSSNTSVAVIGTSTGIVSGLAGGTSAITYTTTTGCESTTAVTVNTSSAITGADDVCVGSTTTLSNGTPGGTWSSSNTALATVGSSSGIVTGVAVGTPVISYNLTGSCSSAKSIVVGASGGAITGSSGVCVGSSITLSNNTSGGTWSSSSTNAAVSGGVVTGVSAGTATIMYTVTTACGTATATKTVNIDAMPNAGTITGASIVCAGNTITLTDIVTGGIWSSSSTKAKVTGGVVKGIAPGMSTISYTVSNACGAIAATKTVTVNPLPDEGSISGAASVCEAASVTLTESVSGGVWSSSNPKATVSGGVVSGVTAGSATISYTVSNSCGVLSALHHVIVNPLPVAGSISGVSNLCIGSAIVLTDGITGGIWSSSNAKATVSGGIVTGISAGAVSISYTVTNVCGSLSAVKAITVDPTIIPSVSFTAPTGLICGGTTVSFTATPSGGGLAPVYNWKVNGVATGVTGSTYAYVATNGDVVSTTLHSSALCTVPDSASYATIMSITPSVMPTATVSAVPGVNVCKGSMVTYSLAIGNGGTSPVYSWSVNGVVVSTSMAFTYVPKNGDIVNSVLTSNAVCRLDTVVNSNNLVMVVDAGLIPSVLITHISGVYLETGKADTFNTTVLNGGTTPVYQWYINNVAATGPTANAAQFITSAVRNNDSVSCQVTKGGPCAYKTFNAIKMKLNPTAVTRVTRLMNDIRLVPNPNKGSFAVNGMFSSAADEEVSFDVTNMLGQTVYRSKAITNNGNINEKIELDNNLSNGMYLMHIRIATESKTVPFMLSH